MDTLTQAALGATVGQAFFARRLGRKANWFGALGGLVPDFDVLFGAFTNEWGSLVWHRGPTHALWFGPVVGPLLGWLCWRYYRRKSETRGSPPPGVPDPGDRAALPAWMGLWILAIVTHPLLDTFTTYGTQLLAPFANTRFSLHGVAIIDPLYTGVLALALIIGWRSRTRPRRAQAAGAVALAISTLYLGYALHQNTRARDIATAQLAGGPTYERLDAYPTLFQPWLRRLVAWYPDRVEVGFVSTFSPRPITWIPVERARGPAVETVLQHPNAKLFTWFADDRLVAHTQDVAKGTLVELDDFRLGYTQRPERALWGIRALVAPDGTLLDGPARFRHPTPDVRGGLTDIWDATFPE